MIKNIFDTHAHYDDEAFDGDRDELLASLPQKGIVGIINCGTDIKTSLFSKKLSEKYPYIKFAAGIHPHEASEIQDGDFDSLADLLKDKNCVAIGEIGLDFHYDFSPRDLQKEVFAKQLELSKKFDIPVIIHDREAHEDTLELVKKYQPKGVVHCFSGSAQLAKIYTDMGMYIGIGGALTFKNARKPVEVVKSIPMDRLLLETDCPYMTPVPFRGQRNNSAYIENVVLKISEITNISPEEIANITLSNAKTLFDF